MTKKLPFVRCKLAMSLDARTAMASGESRWITSLEARQDVQRWRARSNAIITGIDTVLLDDPSLTVRASEMAPQDAILVPSKQPLRVVLDSQLRTPITAKLFKQSGETAIIFAAHNVMAEHALISSGAELQYLPGEQGQVDLRAMLEWLAAEKQCNEVWMEAGATLSGAFIQAGLVDELIIYMAPKLLGDNARPLLHLPGMQMMNQQIPLHFKDVSPVGEDWRFVMEFKK
jgi:diaminohydroxyphosphoribosylaminopyrimidine deaminase/5-amino-6-(5-phosphoribosylamino)uracil reductase